MTQLLPNIFAIEVPEDADPNEWKIFDVDGKSYLNGLTEDGTMYAGTSPLPGSYEILFTTKDCTEEQAATLPMEDSGISFGYKDYEGKQASHFYADHALISLLRSNGLDPNKNYLLLRRAHD